MKLRNRDAVKNQAASPPMTSRPGELQQKTHNIKRRGCRGEAPLPDARDGGDLEHSKHNGARVAQDADAARAVEFAQVVGVAADLLGVEFFDAGRLLVVGGW